MFILKKGHQPGVYVPLRALFLVCFRKAPFVHTLPHTRVLQEIFGTTAHKNMSHDTRKSVYGVSDQVSHKPGCTATEDGKRLEISDLGSTGIVLFLKQK